MRDRLDYRVVDLEPATEHPRKLVHFFGELALLVVSHPSLTRPVGIGCQISSFQSDHLAFMCRVLADEPRLEINEPYGDLRLLELRAKPHRDDVPRRFAWIPRRLRRWIPPRSWRKAMHRTLTLLDVEPQEVARLLALASAADQPLRWWGDRTRQELLPLCTEPETDALSSCDGTRRWLAGRGFSDAETAFQALHHQRLSEDPRIYEYPGAKDPECQIWSWTYDGFPLEVAWSGLRAGIPTPEMWRAVTSQSPPGLTSPAASWAGVLRELWRLGPERLVDDMLWSREHPAQVLHMQSVAEVVAHPLSPDTLLPFLRFAPDEMLVADVLDVALELTAPGMDPLRAARLWAAGFSSTEITGDSLRGLSDDDLDVLLSFNPDLL